MTEDKPKKREWVKNAVIIFLVILLILTFFSNTIMNWSLPEVAIQYVGSGSINAQIRGTGTVTPVESYEVKVSDSRKVKTVYAKVGDEVSAGDLLLVLSTDDSAELESARDALETAQYNYRTKLIQASSADYAQQNRNIEKLNTQIAEKTAEMEAVDLSTTEYDAAQTAVNEAEAAYNAAEAADEAAKETVDRIASSVTAQQKVVTAAREKRDQYSQGSGDYSGVSSAEAAYDRALDALSEAQNELDTAMLVYGDDYNTLKEEARDLIIEDYNKEHTAVDEDGNEIEGGSAFEQLTESQQEALLNSKYPSYIPAVVATKYSDEGNKYKTAYESIKAAQDGVSSAEASVQSARVTLANAEDNYYSANSGNSQWNKYNRELTKEQETLDTLQNQKDDADAAQAKTAKALTAAGTTLEKAKTRLTEAETDLKTRKDSYSSLDKEIDTLEDSLADALFNLAQDQKTDSINAQLESLELEKMRNEISELQEKVDKLTTSGGASEIYSDVNGVVQSVSISAGSTTTPDTALVTIEVPDRGYTTEISVTNEQAQKVQVGTYADVSTSWWGSYDISARLATIRTDPKNPRESKLLVFELTGSDVTSGNSITLSIGERSQSYSTVVPKSAVRSDSNGSFVLIVEAKSSPLGNRYTAKRMDVTVVAEDDVNCAVSGNLTTSDCVITTSTAPVESGTQVRMAE